MIVNHFNELLLIRWHRGLPSPYDPFYLWNPNPPMARAGYYGNNYNPRFFIDGIIDGVNNYPIWDGLVTGRTTVDSPLDMIISGEWNDSTREAHTDVRIDVYGNVPSSDLALYVGLMENNLYFQAPNGVLWHSQVFRELLCPLTGISVSLTPNQSYNFHFDFTLDGEYVASNMEMFAFVQQMTSKEILQGAKAFLTQLSPTQPAISIGMIPNNPPIEIPAGGSFNFMGTLTNNIGLSQSVDVWIMVDVPGYGLIGPIQRFNNIPLLGYQILIAQNVVQSIPGNAPLGIYNYMAYAGDYPAGPLDSASFPFTVTASSPRMSESWSKIDWFGSDKDQVIKEKTLLKNDPNPFNTSTSISFNVPEAGEATLGIYNLMGQRVATLIDGKLNDGQQNITWDAADFASGIYFYQLKIGDETLTRRMTLLK